MEQPSSDLIAELKRKRRTEDLRTGAIGDVEFIWAAPSYGDAAEFARQAQQSPVMANAHLLQTCIVHPDPAATMGRLRAQPLAVGRFIDRFISPLLGSTTEIAGGEKL